jgi:ABC-2 type transport system permease protein
MSRLHQTWEVAKREFLQRAKSRGFQVMLLVTAGLILALGPVISAISTDAEPIRVGLTAAAPSGSDAAIRQQSAAVDVSIETVAYPTLDAATEGLRGGAVDAVYTGSTIVWPDEESTVVQSVIAGAAASVRFAEVAQQLGVSEAELAAALTPPALESRILSPPDPEAEPRRIGALIAVTLLYMSILIFGQFVALGVMEEKQNRVVEVVLSRVEPAELLIGKVVGIGALGLLQVVALGGSAWFALGLADLADISVSRLGGEIFLSVILWFLLGYTMYAVIYAALGATVSRQEDLQSTLILPVVVMVPGFLVGQFAQEQPDSLVVVIASLVPLWSPMVMPTRVALGSVPLWQPILAVVLVVVFTYLVIRAAARVYRGAVLRLGAKVRLREAWHTST